MKRITKAIRKWYNPVEPEKRRREDLPGLITDRPQISIICGKKGSGKTQLVLKLLLNNYRYVYERIIFISPTFKAQFDDVWSSIDPEGIEVHDQLSDQLVKKIYDEMTLNSSPTLLVFDDCGQDLKTCEPRLVNLLVSNSRHRKLSMIVLCQKLTQLPTILRCNADSYCMFSSSSYIERECLHKEISTVSKKDFNRLFNLATEKPYSFLVSMMSRCGQLKLYYSDFKTLVQ